MKGDGVADVMLRARDYVAQGWCQGWFGRDAQHQIVSPSDLSEAESVCAFGALLKADDCGLFGWQDADASEAQPFFWRHFPRITGQDGSVGAWNDSPLRTQADVIQLFDTLATLAKAEAA